MIPGNQPPETSSLTQSFPPLVMSPSSSSSGSSSSPASSSLSSSHFSFPSSSSLSQSLDGKKVHPLTVEEYHNLLRQIFPVLPKKQAPHPCYTWLRGFRECVQLMESSSGRKEELPSSLTDSSSTEVMMNGNPNVAASSVVDPILTGNVVNLDYDQGQASLQRQLQPQDLLQQQQEPQERHLRRQQEDRDSFMPLILQQLQHHQHPLTDEVDDQQEQNVVAGVKDSSLSSQEAYSSSGRKRPMTSYSTTVDIPSLAAAIELERQREALESMIQQQEEEENAKSFFDDRILVTSQRPKIIMTKSMQEEVNPFDSSKSPSPPSSSSQGRSYNNNNRVKQSSSTGRQQHPNLPRYPTSQSSSENRPIPKAPKRALECLRKCIAQRQLHPVQCHSIC